MTADPTSTGLNILLVSMAVLLVMYNVWCGWHNGVVRQICRLIAIGAGYVFGALVGPMVAPLLTFIELPPFAVKLIACFAVGMLVFLILTILTNILFRKTGEQKSTIVRWLYGLGGALIGLLLSAVLLLLILAGIRMTGTVAEVQLEVAEKRHEPLPPAREAYLQQTVRAKRTIENGPAGPALKAVDPTPESVYVFLNKLSRVTADPVAMKRFMDFPESRTVAAHPAMLALAKDTVVQRDLQDRNFGALFSNPKVLEAWRDETLRPLLQKFELQRALDYSLSPAVSPAPTPRPVQRY